VGRVGPLNASAGIQFGASGTGGAGGPQRYWNAAATGALGKPAPDPGDKAATFGYAAYATAGGVVTAPSSVPSPGGSLTLVGEAKHGAFTVDLNAVGVVSGPGSTNSGVNLSQSATGGGTLSVTWQSASQQHSVSLEGYGYGFTGTAPPAAGAAGPGVTGGRGGGGISYSRVLQDSHGAASVSLGVSASVVHEQTTVAPSGTAPGFTTSNTTGFITVDLTIIRPRGY
jgi:hypothetical protein